MIDRVNVHGRLARPLRLEREGRRWSQADLAQRFGVSRAVISKIERGEASATATRLARLSAAFRLTLAGLLVGVYGSSDRMSRADVQPPRTDPETGWGRGQWLTLPDHPTELAKIDLAAGKEMSFPASTCAFIRQAVWVVKGRLTILEAGEGHDLVPANYLAFGPPSDATLSNDAQEPCKYAVALARR